MKNVEEFKGTGDYSFSVSKSQTVVVDATGTHQGEDEISFCILAGEKELRINKQPLVVSLSKDEIKRLAIQLLKLSVNDVPDNGTVLEIYQDYEVTVHQAQESDGSKVNEPIIYIDNIEPEDIAGDGCISICIGDESAKRLIDVLAKIA